MVVNGTMLHTFLISEGVLAEYNRLAGYSKAKRFSLSNSYGAIISAFMWPDSKWSGIHDRWRTYREHGSNKFANRLNYEYY